LKKLFKGAIFDLDGTLLDTLSDLRDSVNEVLATFGHPPHSEERYKMTVGRGFRDLLTRSFPEGSFTDKTIDEALRRFILVYDRNYNNKTQPYPGIVEMLETLAERKIKMGVNSNKRSDYSSSLIQAHFPGVPFVGVFGEREGIPRKPDPHTALELSRLMDLSPENIIYIGDSKTDIQTGKNAGMGTAGVSWGFTGIDGLAMSDAEYIVKSAREIVELFFSKEALT